MGRAATADVLVAALQAAHNGSRVFPVRGKRPLLGCGWRDIATRDPSTICLWFGGDVYPNPGLGAIPPDGIVRVDVDKRADKDGDRMLSRWRSAGYELPESLMARTPSGGRHIYLRAHASVKGGPLCPDGSVELKVGSTILPPTRGYAWLGWGDESIADLPAWVVNMREEERTRHRREHPHRPPRDVDELADLIAQVTCEEVRWRGDFGAFHCPAHDDRRSSGWLCVNGRVGCFAGCDAGAILAALEAS
jgi:hypothetical protein